MAQELRSVTVKLHTEIFEQISFLSRKRGETLSETFRHLLDRGLEEKIYKENIDLLGEVVREQLESVMKSFAVYPSLDDTENPLWAGENLFNCRVGICRADRLRNRKMHNHSV